jgi:hypothetical protein
MRLLRPLIMLTCLISSAYIHGKLGEISPLQRAEDYVQSYESLVEAGKQPKEIYVYANGVYYTPVTNIELMNNKTRLKVTLRYHNKSLYYFFNVEEIEKIGAW